MFMIQYFLNPKFEVGNVGATDLDINILITQRTNTVHIQIT